MKHGSIESGRIINFFRTGKDFKNIILNHHTIIAFMPSTAIKLLLVKVIMTLIGTKISARIIVIERANPIDSLTGVTAKFLKSILYKFADRIVCQTEEPKRLLDLVKLNVNVIGNGANTASTHSYDLNRTSKSQIKIAFLGRITELKNPLLLPEICSKLDDFGVTEPVLAGDGDLKQSLLEAFNCKGITNFNYIGELENVETLFDNLGVLVFISKSEGFPNVILEALSWGWEVVSFDVEFGPADISKLDPRVHLVKYMDTNALVDTIIKVRNKMSQVEYKRRYYLHPKLRSDNVYKQWESLITDTLR